MENRNLLRFTTAGSVDDGKSTLIGRLLYDSKSIFEDQLEQVEDASKRRGKEEVDLSLLTDGLKAEREQGITIDVAYRYFATPKRKFIIADTPGHIQYTRNMVTGASTANLALILVDARNGVLEQTLRHTYISSLLNIKHVVFCINKMDLVDYSEARFHEIKTELQALAEKLNIEDDHYFPISAKQGDNVVEVSERMTWYTGSTLLNLLETIEIKKDNDFDHCRFAVQHVIRPSDDAHHDYRGYAGRVAGGIFKVGQKVTVLPSMKTSTISRIDRGEESLQEAVPNESCTLVLEHDIDISRGDMIVDEKDLPSSKQNLDLMVCWFTERPLQVRGKYLLFHASNEVRCLVSEVDYKMDINTLEEHPEDKQVGMNDIAKIAVKTTQPLFADGYRQNHITGSMILIDEATNETVAAGIVL